MTFKPNYCPDVIDFVIAYDWIRGFVNDYNKLLKKVGETNVRLKFRDILESDLMDAVLNDSGDVLDTITKDSIVLVHGEMGGNFRGIRTALGLARKTDARVITTYTSSYHKNIVDLLKTENYVLNSPVLPFSPINQLSFLLKSAEDFFEEGSNTNRYLVKLASYHK